MSIFPNPMGQAQGLLGKYYDPAEARKQALWSALTQGGLALLSQGPSQTPITLGSTLATGVKGGILGAQQGQQDYMQQGLLAKNMADAEAERQRQIREDAWRNTDRQRQLEQQQREDDEREKKEAADRAQRQMLENMLKPTFTRNGQQALPYTPEQQQAARFGLAGNDVASAYQALQPSQQDPFTLGEGQIRYDGRGNPIAAGPGGSSKPTDDMREYEYYTRQAATAGQQPVDFYTWQKAKATQVTMNSGSEVGTIPQGFELYTTPEGGRAMRPVKGGPAWQEQEQFNEKMTNRETNKAEVGQDVVVANIDEALKLTDNWMTTGLAGQLTQGIGGSPALKLRALIDPIKANIGFDRLQQMRQDSPTGGALGQVAVQELDMLQATLGSLNPDAGPEILARNLNLIRELYTRALERNAMHGKNKGAYSPPPPAGDQSDPLGLRR